MAIPANKKSDHITAFRQICTALTQAAQQADAFLGLYSALDLGNSMADEDFKGGNEGLTKEEFINAIAAIDGLLEGLDTNVKGAVYKLLV